MKPIDQKEMLEIQAQIKAEPQYYRSEWKAYPPKVTIQNDIFPRPHEVYNCTTCKNGEREHPAYAMNKEQYKIKCVGWNKQINKGPRWNDINCPKWERRDKRPRKGYLPGVEI